MRIKWSSLAWCFVERMRIGECKFESENRWGVKLAAFLPLGNFSIASWLFAISRKEGRFDFVAIVPTFSEWIRRKIVFTFLVENFTFCLIEKYSGCDTGRLIQMRVEVNRLLSYTALVIKRTAGCIGFQPIMVESFILSIHTQCKPITKY